MDHRDALLEATKLLGDRGATYGGVEESFTRAAKLASLKLDREITAYDVAIIMESVKDARRAVNPSHLDSHLDGINYRAFAAEFATKDPVITGTVTIKAPQSKAEVISTDMIAGLARSLGTAAVSKAVS